MAHPEWLAAKAQLEERMATTSLARLAGVEMSLRLAGHGLRTIADLDALVMAYREKELGGVMGLKRTEARALLRALLEYTQREFLGALARVRRSDDEQRRLTGGTDDEV
jgi:hypothetical protein